MSVDKVLEAAKTITTIRVRMPKNGTYFTQDTLLDGEAPRSETTFDIFGKQILIWVAH